MSQKPKYKIYPSLLDKFQRYLDITPEEFLYQDADGVWHRNFNESTGEFQFSPSEVDEMAKKDLIDAINRVRTTSVAATKGTAFNELVDSFIHKKRSNSISMRGDKSNDIIYVECEGEKFQFSYSFVEYAASIFEDSLSQVFTSACLETDYGVVELYGYIDELKENKVRDIKTSKVYNFGNYRKYWQQHVYPYCLIESGDCDNIDSFVFDCFVLKGGTEKQPIITGVHFPEEYTYQHEYSRGLLKSFCEQFIEFIEENRDLITDKKIFCYA